MGFKKLCVTSEYEKKKTQLSAKENERRIVEPTFHVGHGQYSVRLSPPCFTPLLMSPSVNESPNLRPQYLQRFLLH